MTSDSCQRHTNLNHTTMEVHYCSCNFCKATTAMNDSSDAISSIAHEDLNDDKNPCTATNKHNATTFQSLINHPPHKCISSTFTSNTSIFGEQRNRYCHHRWRRRSVTASSPWCRWGILMEEEFPFVSLCLPTGFRQNPSSQEGLVKLSSLTMMTLAALVVVSTSITNWFYDYFGACMITMMRLSLLTLLILVFLNQFFLVNLILDYIRLLVFDTIVNVVIRCANNARKIYDKHLVTFVMSSTIKTVINIYSNVKKTVVVGSMSRREATKNKFNPSDKIFPSTSSSVVFLLYTTLIAISQSTGKKNYFDII